MIWGLGPSEPWWWTTSDWKGALCSSCIVSWTHWLCHAWHGSSWEDMGHRSLGFGLPIPEGWGVECESLLTLGLISLCLPPSLWVCPFFSLLLKALLFSNPGGDPCILSAGSLDVCKRQETLWLKVTCFPLLKNPRGKQMLKAWLLVWSETKGNIEGE